MRIFRVVVFLVLILHGGFPINALAATSGDSPAVRFIPFSSESAKQSAGSCSGVFISDEGHFLTAFHCLQGLTNSRGNFLESLGYHGIESKSWTDFVAGGRRTPGDIRISKVSLGKTGLRTFEQQTGIGIVLLGAGFPRFGVPNETELDEETLSNYQSLNEDFAILKMPAASAARYGCTVLAKEEPVDGTWLAAHGYSRVNLPPDTPYWETPAKMSQGRSVELAEADFVPVCQDLGAIVELNENPHRLYESWKQTWDSKTSFSMTGEGLPGMSGGPVLNANDELVGISSAAGNFVYLSDSTPFIGATRATFVREQAQAILGADAAKRVFNCEKARWVRSR